MAVLVVTDVGAVVVDLLNFDETRQKGWRENEVEISKLSMSSARYILGLLSHSSRGSSVTVLSTNHTASTDKPLTFTCQQIQPDQPRDFYKNQ